jgi:hypothetical protein
MGCITFFSVLKVLICVMESKHYKQGSWFITSKEVGLEVNAAKTVFENSGQCYNQKIADKTLKNVILFIYLGLTLTNEPQVYEEIMSGLNLWSERCHSFENLWSFSPLCKNVKMKIWKTIILLPPSSL